MRDASETPATPMMPHMRRSVSHASRNGAEIYVSEPRDRLLDLAVPQADAEGPVGGTDSSRTVDRNPQLTRERLHSPGALRRARDDHAAVGFAEQQFVRRATCVVRRQIHIETVSAFLVGPTHGHFGQRNGEAALRAVV